jgi:isoquinoline 1-oxidoreductase beta subunit
MTVDHHEPRASGRTDPSPVSALSRRRFLQAGAAAGGGLLLGLRLPFGAGGAEAAGAFAPNAFVRIGGDGSVVLTMPYVEMGQGTYTSIPMLIAEELEVELTQVRLEHAPPDETRFANPLLGVQLTGNSNAIRGAWQPMRMAGATARTMLVEAAARRWGVDPRNCRVQGGVVHHPVTGRRLGYGELAADAARLPVPGAVALKRPGDFRLIGKPAKRLDAPAKVDGTALHGIDVRPPGVKFATLAQSPVFGGRLRRVHDGAALAVKGVRQVVRLDDAVAVVADHMGAAKKGLAALAIRVGRGPACRPRHRGDRRRARGGDAEGRGRRRDGRRRRRRDGGRDLTGRGLLPGAVPRPRDDGADELHRPPARGGLRDLGRHPGSRAARAEAARAAGLPPEKVVLHNYLIGGGFGRRLEVDGIVRAVEIARHVNGSVKVVWTREEDVQHDLYRPMFFDRLSAGLDAEGRPVAWNHRFAGSSVIARYLPPAFANGLDPDTTEGAIDLVYDLPNLHVEYVRVEPPGIPTAFWRSVGPSHNVFVIESFMDELAAAAGREPVAYRLALLDRSPRARVVLALAAEKAGWGETMPPGTGRGVSVQNAFGTFMAQVAEVEVGGNGAVRVRRVVCAVDCGVVVNPDTVEAQIQSAIMFGVTAALYGEITVRNGRVEQGNFDTYPLLRIDEAPMVEVHIIPSREAPGGMGEAGTSAIVPAVANAVFAATGTRLRKMPIDQAALKRSG